VKTMGSPKSESLTTEALRVVFDAAPDAIVVVDEQGLIRAFNVRVEELFGYEPEELLGRDIEILVPGELRSRHREERATYSAAPTVRPIGTGIELSGQHKSGAMIPVDICLSPVRIDGATFVIAAVRDVTERDRLREWGVSALRAAEEERERIALELHDDMAQRLAALMVRLRLARQAPESEERESLMDEMRGEIQECADAVRRIARGLRPPALEVGVVAAIQAHVRSLRDSGELTVEVQVERGPGVPRLSRDTELALYRVVQEALANAMRHSQADAVVVRIRTGSAGISAMIEDDGLGFDPAQLGLRGLGIVGMRERARNAGGELAIDSHPGAGTRVRVAVPSIGSGGDGDETD